MFVLVKDMERQDTVHKHDQSKGLISHWHWLSASAYVQTSMKRRELNSNWTYDYELQIKVAKQDPALSCCWQSVELLFLRDAADRQSQQLRTLGTVKLKLVGTRMRWQFCQALCFGQHSSWVVKQRGMGDHFVLLLFIYLFFYIIEKQEFVFH